ncbi:MAG: MFS transporter [Desulfobulbaceae bacterium DB1]|nr:MAG: MFS transporter [Desulfobulbaceae bacterium DB1]
MGVKGSKGKSVLAWAFYDWANSAFATCIMAGFFPIFFKQYWCSGMEVSAGTFRLGLANSIGSMIVIVLAPLLGAVSDQAGGKKKFLFFFTLLGAVMSGSLFFVPQGAWLFAFVLYIGGIIGFSGGNVFYDSLLINVATPAESDRVSALGFALGYLGGGLIFAFHVTTTIQPGLFGLPDAGAAVRFSFLSVAAWWIFFSLPLFFLVPESASGPPKRLVTAAAGGCRQLAATFREIKKARVVLLFLIAYWLYIDGLDTIVRMAVDYGLALGFSANDLILALLITQFIGFPAALIFGRLGEKIGTKQAILAGICVYLLVTIWAMFMKSVSQFYLMAAAIGLVQGGVQSLSRSLYSRIIPPDRSAEFFGFYNMLGKFAAVIGPLLMGVISLATGSPRLSLLAVILLFVIGGAILCLVDEKEGIRLARQLEKTKLPG